MDNWQVGAAVGGILVLFGLTLIRTHVVNWRRIKNDPHLPDRDRHYYYRRYRRRMQTSGLLAVIGVLIPVGDSLIPWQNFPGLFLAYWGGIVLLALWMILLALGDYTSTRVHSQAELDRIRQKQAALEAQVARMKRHGANGHTADE